MCCKWLTRINFRRYILTKALHSFSGIATHFVPSERLPHLEDRLSELESDDHEVINAAIEDFVEKPEPNYRYALGGQIRESIDR